eukprot:6194603-Pleurochrysis_carterae.AAC.2
MRLPRPRDPHNVRVPPVPRQRCFGPACAAPRADSLTHPRSHTAAASRDGRIAVSARRDDRLRRARRSRSVRRRFLPRSERRCGLNPRPPLKQWLCDYGESSAPLRREPFV